MACEGGQMPSAGPAIARDQFFTVRSPAPVHRITVLREPPKVPLKRMGDPTVAE
jgi:hypothetical protein